MTTNTDIIASTYAKNKIMQELRWACLQAINEKYKQEFGLMMDRLDENEYGSFWYGDAGMVFARIPDIKANPLEVFLELGKISDEK